MGQRTSVWRVAALIVTAIALVGCVTTGPSQVGSVVGTEGAIDPDVLGLRYAWLLDEEQ